MQSCCVWVSRLHKRTREIERGSLLYHNDLRENRNLQFPEIAINHLLQWLVWVGSANLFFSHIQREVIVTNKLLYKMCYSFKLLLLRINVVRPKLGNNVTLLFCILHCGVIQNLQNSLSVFE